MTTGTGAVWRTAGVRPGDRVAVIGCGGVGMSARARRASPSARAPVVAVDVARGRSSSARAGARARRTRVRWAGGAEATAERVLEARAAAASTTRSRRPGAPRRALAAFLSTRARGAAVLIGIPRADAVLPLPALPIPRMERRVLGSIYGSSRPERDFPRAARPLPARPAAARPAGLAPAAARRGGGGLRPDARRRGAARGARPGGGVMTDPLDGRIGEAWAGEVPNGSHVNVVLARRGSPTAAAAAGALARPRPGTRRSSPASGAGRGRAPGHDRGQQGARSPTSELTRITWGAAQLGIAQGVLDAVADGLLDAAEAGRLVAARRASGSIPRRTTRRRCGCANREAMREAIADALRAAGGGRCEALVERREDAPRTPSTAGDVTACGSPPSRCAATRRRSTRRSAAAWDPVPRTRAARRALVIVRADDGLERLRERRRPARRRRCSSGCSSGSTRCAPRSCASSARPSTSTAAGRGRPRSRSGTSRRARSDEPLWRLLGGRSERLARLRVERRAASRRRSARGAWPRCATRGVRAVKLRFHHADWRERRRGGREPVRDAVGRDVELMVDANQGWRMAGDRSRALGRRDRGAVRARARAARRLLARGAAADRRRRRLRGAAAAHVAADRGRRDGARRCSRRATSCCAAAST